MVVLAEVLEVVVEEGVVRLWRWLTSCISCVEVLGVVCTPDSRFQRGFRIYMEAGSSLCRIRVIVVGIPVVREQEAAM